MTLKDFENNDEKIIQDSLKQKSWNEIKSFIQQKTTS